MPASRSDGPYEKREGKQIKPIVMNEYVSILKWIEWKIEYNKKWDCYNNFLLFKKFCIFSLYKMWSLRVEYLRGFLRHSMKTVAFYSCWKNLSLLRSRKFSMSNSPTQLSGSESYRSRKNWVRHTKPPYDRLSEVNYLCKNYHSNVNQAHSVWFQSILSFFFFDGGLLGLI